MSDHQHNENSLSIEIKTNIYAIMNICNCNEQTQTEFYVQILQMLCAVVERNKIT